MIIVTIFPEREHDINRGIMAAQQGGMGGVPYAYNLPNQAHLPPSVESSFYPSPWAAPGYGIFPFGPPGMMMPGLPPGVAPPATDFSTNDLAPPITYLDRRKGKWSILSNQLLADSTYLSIYLYISVCVCVCHLGKVEKLYFLL